MENIMSAAFWKAAGARAIHTVAQSLVGTIGAGVMFQDVQWHIVLSASVFAGILSILKSITTGVPEIVNQNK